MRVVLIDKRRELLSFLDDEIVAALTYQLRRNRVTMRLGEEVAGVEVVNGGAEERVRLQLASGKQIVAERAMYSIGRSGATATLGLEAAGIESTSTTAPQCRTSTRRATSSASPR